MVHHLGMSDTKHLLAMIPGPQALEPENLIRVFEAIKGRPATPEELAEFEAKAHRLKHPEAAPAPARRQFQPSRWGRPMEVAPGTGFGVCGGAVSRPADPAATGEPAKKH